MQRASAASFDTHRALQFSAHCSSRESETPFMTIEGLSLSIQCAGDLVRLPCPLSSIVVTIEAGPLPLFPVVPTTAEKGCASPREALLFALLKAGEAIEDAEAGDWVLGDAAVFGFPAFTGVDGLIAGGACASFWL